MLPLSRMLAIAGLAFLLAVPAQAQSEPAHPDLSGTWKLSPAKSTAGIGGLSGAESMIIRCSGQTMQVRSTSPGHDSTRTYVVDGKEHSADKWDGGSVHALRYFKAEWKGSTLFIEIRVHTYDPDNPVVKTPDSRATQLWTLSGNGRVLTLSSGSFGSSGLSSPVQVYNKQ
jgi:hypothetical protein